MRVLTPCLVGLLFGMQESLAQALAVSAGGKDTATVAFVNVALVSMQDEAVLQGHTVVIQGERIGSAGPVDAISVPSVGGNGDRRVGSALDAGAGGHARAGPLRQWSPVS